MQYGMLGLHKALRIHADTVPLHADRGTQGGQAVDAGKDIFAVIHTRQCTRLPRKRRTDEKTVCHTFRRRCHHVTGSASGFNSNIHTKYATTGALSDLETALDERLDALEEFDHSTYATKTELTEVSTIANNANTNVTNLEQRFEEIVAVGGEPNAINKIQVNGVVQAIEDKTVNIAVPTKFSDLTDDSGFDARITAAKTQADKGVADAAAADAKAVKNAEEIAKTSGNQSIENVHLLKALFKSDDYLIPNLFNKLGVNVDAFNKALDKAIASLPKVHGGSLYLSNETNRWTNKARNSCVIRVACPSAKRRFAPAFSCRNWSYS